MSRKLLRQFNLTKGYAALEILVANDFSVHPFSDIHFRINNRLDIWPSTKRFYDIRSHRKGIYSDDLTEFVTEHFKRYARI